MRRGTGLLGLVGATAALSLGVTHLPEVLSESDLFRVAQVDVEGARYLAEEEALEVAAVASDANLWDRTDDVAERLRGHALIQDARVRRRFPRTLVLEVVERDPVALLPTPTLTPVDRHGRSLPVDPAFHVLDLPLLQPAQEGMDRSLTPAQIRDLASEIHRLSRLDPLLHGSLSDVSMGSWGEVVLRLAEPRVTVRYPPPMTPGRLREGLLVLADVMERHPDRTPNTVDLRFADQVVVRLDSSAAR
jgi:cell division septal protein FtsQ